MDCINKKNESFIWQDYWYTPQEAIKSEYKITPFQVTEYKHGKFYYFLFFLIITNQKKLSLLIYYASVK